MKTTYYQRFVQPDDAGGVNVINIYPSIVQKINGEEKALMPLTQDMVVKMTFEKQGQTGAEIVKYNEAVTVLAKKSAYLLSEDENYIDIYLRNFGVGTHRLTILLKYGTNDVVKCVYDFVVKRVDEGTLDIDSSNVEHIALQDNSGDGGIEDAPEDGKLYGREDGAWEEIKNIELFDVGSLSIDEDDDTKIIIDDEDLKDEFENKIIEYNNNFEFAKLANLYMVGILGINKIMLRPIYNSIDVNADIFVKYITFYGTDNKEVSYTNTL